MDGEWVNELRGITVAGLGDRAGTLAQRIGEALAGADASLEARQQAGVGVLAAALGAALVGAGWSVESLPGEPVTVRGPAAALEPLREAGALARDGRAAEAWPARCAAAGIATLTLGPVRRTTQCRD